MYAWICNVRQEIVPVASSYSRRLECESQARRNLCGCTEQSQSLQSRDRNTFVQHADTCRRNTRVQIVCGNVERSLPLVARRMVLRELHEGEKVGH